LRKNKGESVDAKVFSGRKVRGVRKIKNEEVQQADRGTGGKRVLRYFRILSGWGTAKTLSGLEQNSLGEGGGGWWRGGRG